MRAIVEHGPDSSCTAARHPDPVLPNNPSVVAPKRDANPSSTTTPSEKDNQTLRVTRTLSPLFSSFSRRVHASSRLSPINVTIHAEKFS